MTNRIRKHRTEPGSGLEPVAVPLVLTGAHPVLPLLRDACDDGVVALVSAWLDRRLAAAEPVGLEDELDELAVWLDLPDPLLHAVRLAHLAATCLVDGPGELDAHALALELARSAGTVGPARQSTLAVLVLALGVVPVSAAGMVWACLDRDSGPDALTGTVAALRTVVAYVHGCFRLPELSPGTLLRDLAAAGTTAGTTAG